MQVAAFGNLVVVSWLEDAGKDVIYVQNTETNDVQKITYEPNLDNFRIVELHPNADPKLFEAVISNGKVPFLNFGEFPSSKRWQLSSRTIPTTYRVGRYTIRTSDYPSRVPETMVCLKRL